jgi:pimeloyl-ACP methyl ester carboxylesterase
MDRIADITVDRWLSDDFRAANSDIDATLGNMMKRTTLAGYQAYVGAFIEMDLTDRLQDMQVPTLLIAAEKDHGGGPPDDMGAMAGQIPGARFEMIAGAGHIVNYEAPDALAALLQNFLRRD